MSDAFQSPRGTLDWLPGPMRARRRVVERAREIFERAGYREVATPVFEDTGLFLRTSGEGSEVVQLMRLFRDHDVGHIPLLRRRQNVQPPWLDFFRCLARLLHAPARFNDGG